VLGQHQIGQIDFADFFEELLVDGVAHVVSPWRGPLRGAVFVIG
jgi:hypothetical protein